MAALLCAGKPKRAERDSEIKRKHDSQYQCHKNGVATDEKISNQRNTALNISA